MKSVLHNKHFPDRGGFFDPFTLQPFKFQSNREAVFDNSLISREI